MVDVQRAVAFVAGRGTPLQIEMAKYAIDAAKSTDVFPLLAAYQRQDGGWTGLDPDCPPGLSTLSCTWLALQYLRWLSADSHPLVESTAAFLAARQHERGYWDEPDDITQHDPPPWMQPGQDAIRAWLTAANARMLLETGHETRVYFGRALTYLTEQWDAGLFKRPETPLHPLWMMLPLFKKGGLPEDDPIVEACMVRLWSAVLFDDLDPMDVIAVAHAALNTRYEGNRLYLAARDKVLAAQQPDGGWPTNYNDAHRPNATLDAIMLLRVGGML